MNNLLESDNNGAMKTPGVKAAPVLFSKTAQ